MTRMSSNTRHSSNSSSSRRRVGQTAAAPAPVAATRNRMFRSAGARRSRSHSRRDHKQSIALIIFPLRLIAINLLACSFSLRCNCRASLRIRRFPVRGRLFEKKLKCSSMSSKSARSRRVRAQKGEGATMRKQLAYKKGGPPPPRRISIRPRDGAERKGRRSKRRVKAATREALTRTSLILICTSANTHSIRW